MTYYAIPTTERQRAYADALYRKLHLTPAAVDALCQQRFNTTAALLDRAQLSALISEMEGWKQAPADLQRAMGQQDLFEVGP